MSATEQREERTGGGRTSSGKTGEGEIGDKRIEGRVDGWWEIDDVETCEENTPKRVVL